MAEHIVIVLRANQHGRDARQTLQTLLPWAWVEPQFRGLPPVKTGEQAVLSEMRRTWRLVSPSETDIEELVQRLQADPSVEAAYREASAAPAGAAAPGRQG
jgi:hypothetical protein